MSEETTRCTADELTRFVTEALVAVSASPESARTVADTLIDAELRGVTSHGMSLLPYYVQFIRKGVVNPRPHITRPVDAGPIAILDGDLGFGQVVAIEAVDIAVTKAQEYGIGVVSARRASHTGALAYYANRIATRSCLGIVISQGQNAMAPTGGARKMVGNNPIAYAFPTRRGVPLSLDMALSVAAGMKVVANQQIGRPLPDGWLFDAEGLPTNDPQVFNPFSPEGGSLVPIGGHKGYGLAIAHDILAGVLSGGRFGLGLGAPGFSLFVQAINIEHFTPMAEYFDRIEALIKQIKDSPRASGSAGIFVPGERSHVRRSAALTEGIVLDSGTIVTLRKVAGDLRVEPIEPMTR
jgi:ureidoglycolate dehydrogenase (NAD+)